MVRHIVLWSYKKELTDEQRREAGSRIRELLEAVAPLVPGTRSLRVTWPCSRSLRAGRPWRPIRSIRPI